MEDEFRRMWGGVFAPPYLRRGEVLGENHVTWLPKG